MSLPDRESPAAQGPGGLAQIASFGECIRLCKEKMDARNIYLTNPAFDKIQPRPASRG